MQAVERLRVLVLRPVTAPGHQLESRARNHRRDPWTLGDVRWRIVTRPYHQCGRGDGAVLVESEKVACTNLGVLQRHDVPHRPEKAGLAVHALTARDDVVIVLRL